MIRTYFLVFLLLILATPVHAIAVNLGDGVYLVSGDDNVARILTREQLEAELQEQRNMLHNASVMQQRNTDAISSDIAEKESILNTPVINTEVDENVY